MKMRVGIILLLVASVFSVSALAENPSTMELAAAPRLLTAGDTPYAEEVGMWEYVYDYYGNGVSQLANLTFLGFDASLIVNRRGVDGNTLSHNWGYSAANDFYASPNTAGSISHDGLTWTVYEGGIDNIWHDPDEYGGMAVYVWALPGFAMQDWGGSINDAGGSVGYTAKVTSGNILNGLLLTVRIVHPSGPGSIEWYSHSYNGGAGGFIAGPGSIPLRGDFDLDGDVDADDIDLLFAAVGGGDTFYDLTDDGLVNQDDVDEWVFNVVPVGGDNVGTVFGDFNLDGAVDAGDLALLGGSFGQAGDFGWATGDATGDGVVDAGDLALLGGNFGTIVHPVPEPASAALLLTGVAALIKRRKS
jgi:hypothetical protein